MGRGVLSRSARPCGAWLPTPPCGRGQHLSVAFHSSHFSLIIFWCIDYILYIDYICAGIGISIFVYMALLCIEVYIQIFFFWVLRS